MLGALVGLSLTQWHRLRAACCRWSSLFGLLQGAVVEWLGVRQSMRAKSEFGWIMATIALGIIFRNLAENIWGRDDLKFPSPLPEAPMSFLGVNILPMEVAVVVGALAMMLAVELFNRRSIYGKAVVATSADRDAAGLMGINTNLVITFSYALSSVTAAFAGVLVGAADADRRHHGRGAGPEGLRGRDHRRPVLGLRRDRRRPDPGHRREADRLLLRPATRTCPACCCCCWCSPSSRPACSARPPSRRSEDAHACSAASSRRCWRSSWSWPSRNSSPAPITSICSSSSRSTRSLLLGPRYRRGLYRRGLARPCRPVRHRRLYRRLPEVPGLGIGLEWALPASIVVTALFGLILALPALRVTGPYLAMVTLAFGTIVADPDQRDDVILTNGPLGITMRKPHLVPPSRSPVFDYYYLRRSPSLRPDHPGHQPGAAQPLGPRVRGAARQPDRVGLHGRQRLPLQGLRLHDLRRPRRPRGRALFLFRGIYLAEHLFVRADDPVPAGASRSADASRAWGRSSAR